MNLRTWRTAVLPALRVAGFGWDAALAVWAVASAIVPVVVLVLLGNIIGAIPGVARGSMSSKAGHYLIGQLVLASIFLAASFVSRPSFEFLRVSTAIRVGTRLEADLIETTSTPAGIGHLEDPALLDRLALANGSLTSFPPGEVPAMVAALMNVRLTGLVACAVLMDIRWWAGTSMLALWLAIRLPLKKIITEQVGAFTGEAPRMRRAYYFMNLACWPLASKELRVFGLAPWIRHQFRSNWLQGMEGTWPRLRDFRLRVAILLVPVMAIYATVVAGLARAAWTGGFGIRELATALFMLMTSSMVGSVTREDIAVTWMLAALEKSVELRQDLAHAGIPMSKASSTDEVVPRPGRITFDGVEFRYPGAAQCVLSDLTLTLEPERVTGLVGLNGAGKTTVVKLLARLYEPTRGRILLDKDCIHDLDGATWKRQVAVVFQDFGRYPLTVRENVCPAAMDGSPVEQAVLDEAALRAGLIDTVRRLPDTWDTRLSPRLAGGRDLSGGEWQRVAVARGIYAILTGAKILVLDEPTSWLDVRGESEFFDLIGDALDRVTTLLVSHRFGTLRRASQILLLDQGIISESGTHEELVESGGLYAALFKSQADHFRPEVGVR